MDDLVATFDTWLQARLEDLHTMLPGVVQSYDENTRTATVKPSIRLRSLHGDILEIPPIPSVPVIWPGNGEFSTFGTLRPGDGVLIHILEASAGNWQRGTAEADAEDETRFTLQDAVCTPGLWPMSKVPKHKLRGATWGMASKDLVIGGSKGKAVIENTETDLRTELEKLWGRVEAINDYVSTWAQALSIVSVGPMSTMKPGFEGLKAAADLENVGLPGDRDALGDLLK